MMPKHWIHHQQYLLVHRQPSHLDHPELVLVGRMAINLVPDTILVLDTPNMVEEMLMHLLGLALHLLVRSDLLLGLALLTMVPRTAMDTTLDTLDILLVHQLLQLARQLLQPVVHMPMLPPLLGAPVGGGHSHTPRTTNTGGATAATAMGPATTVGGTTAPQAHTGGPTSGAPAPPAVVPEEGTSVMSFDSSLGGGGALL